MNEMIIQALNIAEIGIIIVDSQYRIIVWNKYMERISNVKSAEAFNKRLHEVCGTFTQSRYRQMLEAAIQSRQCRFCSSRLHKAFIYPNNIGEDGVRQNMIIAPIQSAQEPYIMIQIVDMTYQIRSEHTLTSLLCEMTKGYDEIRQSEERNKRLAATDLLTGLHNRIGMTQGIKNIIDNESFMCEYALMFVDLDGFKHINDTYGHVAGDKLLVKVAERLKVSTRSEDMLARFGGDEFVILTKTEYGAEGARAVAKKLVEEIAKPMVLEGKAVSITCSVGIVMFEYGDSAQDIIKKADCAMYESKRQGKNTYTFYKQA